MLTDAALAARLQRHVDDGEVPGLVALVSAHEPGVPSTTGEVAVAAIGVKAFGDTEPIGRDAIFRIASISKPIVAVAAMMLVDDGTIALDEPVDAWLPEMAARRVMRTPDGPIDDTVPAKRAITVRDLLSFRMGFGVLMRAPGSTPIQRAEEALQLRTMGPPWPPPHLTPDGWIAALGTLPLMHQPGEGWMYNTGLQVLGVLLERATSTPLQALLRARLFDPLGMADTGFHVPSSELHRLTTQYDPGDGTMQVLDDPSSSWWATPPAMPNAAGWLVSTIDDLWSFVRFVIEGGRRDDEQLLSPGSMDELLTDQLTAGDRRANEVFLGDGSWGLGMAVPVGAPTVRGAIGWDGGTGTCWRTDTASGTTRILLTQRAMTSPEPPDVFVDFERAAGELARG